MKSELIQSIEKTGYIVSNAYSYLRAYQSILDGEQDRISVISQAPVFFMLASSALIRVTALEVAKLFDPYAKASIPKLLQVCSNYLPEEREHIKSELSMRFLCNSSGVDTEYKEQMRQKRVEIGLLTKADMQDEVIKWGERLKSFEDEHGSYSNLKALRDKFIAHSDKAYIRNIDKLLEEYPIKTSDIKQLLDFANEVSCRLRLYLTGTHVHPEIVGSGDLRRLLDKVYRVDKEFYV